MGIITGLLCFTLGGLIFSDGKKISALEEENLILAAKCESDHLSAKLAPELADGSEIAFFGKLNTLD